MAESMKDSNNSSSNNYQEEDEEEIKVKLKQPLNLQDVMSDGGTFEIDEEFLKDNKPKEPSCNFHLEDAGLFSVLQTGRYCLGDDISDSDEEQEPFVKLASNMEDLTDDGGVYKKMVRSGTGLSISPTATVTYKYSAYLEYSDDPFDSSMFRGKPQRTHLTKPDILYGLQIALKSMRCNETAHFLIRHDYAYGDIGCPPRIPPKATLFYDVTLFSAVDYAAASDYENLTPEQVKEVTFEQKVKVTEEYLTIGNQQFNESRYGKAKKSYRAGSWVIEGARIADEKESKIQLDLLFRLHCNSAQACLGMRDDKGACRRCQDALRYSLGQPKKMLAKAFYRYAEAKRRLYDFDTALRFAKKARALCDTRDIRALIELIARDKNDADGEHRIMYKRMLHMKIDEKPVVLESKVSEDFKKDVEEHITYVIESEKDLDVLNSFNKHQLRYIKNKVEQHGLRYATFTDNNKDFFKLYK